MKASIKVQVEKIKGLKNYVNYLRKVYVKRDGENFISDVNYAKFLLDAITLLNETPETFFNKVDSLNKTRLFHAVMNAANEKYELKNIPNLMVVVRNYINYKLYSGGNYDMYGNLLDYRKAA